MKLSIVFVVLNTLLITGCAPANISSNLRNPSSDNLSMETRCINLKTGNNNDSLLSKYDGWKVVYASEYTTANQSTTTMVMCFEKPY